MLLIVVCAGLAALLASFVLLQLGVHGMALRYFAAALLGYAAFLALIRLWLGYQRRRGSLELADLPGDLPAAEPAELPFTGGGGSFGGGGASGSFHVPEGSALPAPSLPAPAPAPVAGDAWNWGFGLDLDDALPIVLAAAALLAGAVAIGVVIYASPILLAEVLLDAAVLGTVYRRARRREASHWAFGVLRRTWLPAAVLCGFMALLGFTLQSLAPEARSLGGVLRSLTGA